MMQVAKGHFRIVLVLEWMGQSFSPFGLNSHCHSDMSHVGWERDGRRKGKYLMGGTENVYYCNQNGF
jgi:hypothetical protein